MKMSNATIQTYSGQFIDLLRPNKSNMSLSDIPQALGMKARFTGQTKFHYSVAQHCVLGALLLGNTHDVDVQLAFMLHELGEVYLPDIASPLKPHILVNGMTWTELEHIHTLEFIKALGLPYSILDVIYSRPVKNMDRSMLMAEAPVVLGELLPGWGYAGVIPASIPIQEWTPSFAASSWMYNYKVLVEQYNCEF
jgi:uncharacterized protein